MILRQAFSEVCICPVTSAVDEKVSFFCPEKTVSGYFDGSFDNFSLCIVDGLGGLGDGFGGGRRSGRAVPRSAARLLFPLRGSSRRGDGRVDGFFRGILLPARRGEGECILRKHSFDTNIIIE